MFAFKKKAYVSPAKRGKLWLSGAMLPFLLALLNLVILQPGQASPSINGDPYVDELLTNACVAQSSYWAAVKEDLTNGNVDQAIKRCREVMARRPLDIDMHGMYAMSLEMKLRKGQYDPALFDECVREWTKVAKVKILSQSNGWEHVGDGEVFVANQDRRDLARRHLISLVGRAPKYFESEEAFVEKAIQTSTQVSGKIKSDKQL